MASESELIAALTAVFGHSDANVRENVLIGIGDDGAVIAPSSSKSVLAADMAVEGVHFNRKWSTLHEVGAKITAANLADIYAMGGEPKYLLVSAGLTSDFGITEITELATGIADEAALVGASVVGGDISRAEQLVI
jgi:thiamine-monophosphate kinase